MTHQAFQEQLTAELCGVSLQPARESYQHLPVAMSGTVGSKKPHRGAGNAGCVGNALHSCVRHAKCPSVLFWTGTVTSPITVRVACVYVVVQHV